MHHLYTSHKAAIVDSTSPSSNSTVRPLQFAQRTQACPRLPHAAQQAARFQRLPPRCLKESLNNSDIAWQRDEHVAALLKRAAAAGLAVFCSIALAVAPADAETLSFRFKASRDPEIRAGQQTMVESWAYIKSYFVDGRFNGIPWDRAIESALDESFKAKDKAEVNQITDRMIRRLNDPFTRILRKDAALAFSVETEGKVLAPLGQVIANGLAVAPDRDGRARVTFVAEGSPASKARVLLGDELVTINGSPVQRGQASSLGKELNREVDLRLLRTADSRPPPPTAVKARVPNAAPRTAEQGQQSLTALLASTTSTPNGGASSSTSAPAAHGATGGSSSTNNNNAATAYQLQGFVSVHLTPGPVEYSPVQYGSIPGQSLSSVVSRGHSSSSSSSSMEGPPSLGYIKIVVFSETAPREVRDAIDELEREGVQGYIVDLRDNPGGIVGAGVEVADLLLRAGDIFCVAYDRLSGQVVGVTLEEATDSLHGAPLVVLINSSSASTSELVAGALHDNIRPAPAPAAVGAGATAVASPAAAASVAGVLPPGGPVLGSGGSGTLLGTGPDAGPTPGEPGPLGLPPPRVLSLSEAAEAYAAALTEAAEGEETLGPSIRAIPAAPPVAVRGPAYNRVGGALLVGERTFGKGRTQQIIPLADGTSTLLVSTIAYRTPALTMVDHVGIAPDLSCRPGKTSYEYWTPGSLKEATSLLDDPCINVAAKRLVQQLVGMAEQ